jgi:3-phosphoshikimate 1-carboxyvinyltransferase
MSVRSVTVPGDKSITHRALLLGALATGTNRVANVLTGADAHASAVAVRALGCEVPSLDDRPLTFTGSGLHGLTAPRRPLDCANSGTTARLLLGILAGFDFRAVLTGDASLRGRPMRRVTEPLTRMGAEFRELGAPDRLPLEVLGGRLEPLAHASPFASAQVKSALLLAGLTGGARVTVTEPHRSRDHTERMLSAMGAAVTAERLHDGSARVTVEPGETLEPLELRVPGDFSSAAFFIALGLLGDVPVRIDRVGINPTRTGLLPVLHRMGARIELEDAADEGGEPVADLIAYPSRLTATDVAPAEIPTMIDEVPILAVLAGRAEGETRITGASELRVKESDRLAALASNLQTLGTRAEELPDGLVIEGSDAPRSGLVQVHHDHRIAMAFGILAALPGNAITIDDPASTDVSFPGFWQLLRAPAAP